MGSWPRFGLYLASGAVTALVSLGGCAGSAGHSAGAEAPVAADGSKKAGPRKPLPDFVSDDFGARVARARQLGDARPASLEFHDRPAFDRLVEQTAERDGLPPTVVDTPAFQLAFGFALLAKVSSPPFAKVQRENLLAFYDRHTHAVHALRDGGMEGGDAALELLIAHELGHALQAQHFPEPSFASLSGEDARLAQLALFEGDAMLTMLAYQAEQGFMPLGRRLAMARGQAGDVATFERASGMLTATERMSALTRARLEFPYVSGLDFVGELYRAGGFQLVNRSYTQGPHSTEHVLHPERYLRGDQPVLVAVPSVPPGYHAVADGTLGELLTRLALSACVETAEAIVAAEGWGGDAFQIVEKDRQAGLFWATTWDTTEDAREFERAVRELSQCWTAAELTARSVFAGPAWIQRRGRNVAVQRGILPAAAKGFGASLLELPQKAPKRRPPFGPIALRPHKPPPTLGDARREGGRVVVPQMGVSAQVPVGYSPEFSEIVTLISAPPSRARIVLTFSTWMVNPESRERLFAAYAEGVESELQVPLIVSGGDTELVTPLGAATMRTWRMGDQGFIFQLVVVPLCGNTGSLLLAFASEDAATQKAQQNWLSTLAPLPKKPPGLCDVLDP